MKTKSTTTTLTAQEVTELIETGQLSRDEELALRMMYGISVPVSAPLEMRTDDTELVARLAAIEKASLEDLGELSAGEKRNENRDRISAGRGSARCLLRAGA